MPDDSTADFLATDPDSSIGPDGEFLSESPPDQDIGWSQEELSQLIHQHERQLLAYACRMLGGDFQAAQDAVQETFLRLCREPRSKIALRVQPWLFAVCRSRVIDMQRTRHAFPVDADEMAVVDPRPDAATAAIEAERKIAVDHRIAVLVGRLSQRQQEVIRLRIQAGLSYREIAEVTGMTVSNVGFHLHAAMRSLKDAIATA